MQRHGGAPSGRVHASVALPPAGPSGTIGRPTISGRFHAHKPVARATSRVPGPHRPMRDSRLTEQRNPRSQRIDELDTQEVGPSGLRKTIRCINSLAHHRTGWVSESGAAQYC